MVPVLFRLLLLALGLGMVETGLFGALPSGSILSWLTVVAGMILLVAGSAWFMVPLLGARRERRR